MCKHLYCYDDVFPEMCDLTGKPCFEEDGCGFEPDDHDVLNGYFENDPEGYKQWKKEQKYEEWARELTEEHERLHPEEYKLRQTVFSRSNNQNNRQNNKGGKEN